MSTSPLSGAPCSKSSTRIWRITDCAFNSVLCTQTVTLVDTTPPVITCASNKTALCGSVWSFDLPTAVDNCCSNTVTITELGTVTNGICPRYITRTWQATDCCGNSNTCSQMVTVKPCVPGETWTPHGGYNNWWSVASSADGTKLVATVGGGQIWTSTDSGATWLPHATPTPQNWTSVASSANGTKLVAAANGGLIYTSTDSGTNWVARDTSRNWISVASSADGTKLVAAVLGGRIYISSDSGVTWTAHESARAWRGVALSANGRKLVAVEGVSYNIVLGFFLGGFAYTSSCTGSELLINCAPDKAVIAGPGWSFDPPTASSPCCTNAQIEVLETMTNYVCPQVITRTWQVTDCCSNNATCSQIVYVGFDTPPTITCPTNQTRLTCIAPVRVTYSAPTAGGAPPVTVTCTPPSGSEFPFGVSVVTCTATDQCGASANCQFTVTVQRPVNPPCVPIGIVVNGASLKMSWPTEATNVILMEGTNLEGPFIPATNVDITNAGGMTTATVPMNAQRKFYFLGTTN